MYSLGNLLKEQREGKGVSISEASMDLEIKEVVLENIEEGNIGAFKDIYVLKEYIKSYAKYLGLDSDNLVDEFNEYLFEYTSRIPIKEIEKEIAIQNKGETKELKVSSPYTLPIKKHSKKYYVLIYAIIIVLFLIVFIWSIKQITVNTKVTNAISYIK